MIIDGLKDVLLLILGWLLGLLAPGIVALIRDKREGNIIKKALVSELHEFRYRLMLNVYQIESKYGRLDHDFFEWAQAILVDYEGINSEESLLNTIGPLLKLTKDEMKQFAQVAQQQRKPNSGLSLKRHHLVLLDTNIGALAKLDPIFRGRLLEIKIRVGFLNEIIEDSRYYYRLSFQNSISAENYKIADANMVESYIFYASRAKDVIGIIGKVLNQ
ncbi:MAG: hypothetical protein G01um101419_22 [Parcubacteria group bacterium Gr01-1014_19]|nr:MAG: hypothetical protein G01um101419_22 [Parcubacteria group bacterium Gr01-1014_19]